MFQGNIYFVVRPSEARRIFLNSRAETLAKGFYTSEEGGALVGFHNEEDAVAFGKERFRGSPDEEIQQRMMQIPAFAVISIGPIMPAAIPAHTCSETQVQIGDRTVRQLTIAAPGVERIAQIVQQGAFAYNKVDLAMKLFPIR